MFTPTLGTPTLIGLPYDASSSFRRGTAAAPPSIREALHSPAGNAWTETGVDLSRDGALGDVGDVPLGRGAADVRVQDLTIDGAGRGRASRRERGIGFTVVSWVRVANHPYREPPA